MGEQTDKLGQTIAGNTKKVDNLAEDTFPDDQGAALLLAPSDGSKLALDLTVYQRVLASVLTVSHPTYGEVYSYPVYVPIILGHSTWGVLGSGYLSGTAEYSRTVIHTYSS